MPFSETPTKESKWIIFQGVIDSANAGGREVEVKVPTF